MDDWSCSDKVTQANDFRMLCLDLTLTSIEENLACDEALLLEAEAGRQPEILRFWEWPQFAVVLGAGSRLSEDVDEEACRAAGVPIVRRSSGGGTVLLGSGCLCFTLVLDTVERPALTKIGSSYRYILERMARALDQVLPAIGLAGTSDLASLGRKFSGNAQQRKRRFLLHHGTLLYVFELTKIASLLRAPARQPEYRKQRNHDQFLVNMPTNASDLRRWLIEAWQANNHFTQWPKDETLRLVREKYSQVSWNRRR
jgi:lipoate-protein ligase A